MMTDRPTLLVAQPHLAPIGALLARQYEVLSLWEAPTDAQLAEVRAVVVAGEFAIDRALVDRHAQARSHRLLHGRL